MKLFNDLHNYFLFINKDGYVQTDIFMLGASIFYDITNKTIKHSIRLISGTDRKIRNELMKC